MLRLLIDTSVWLDWARDYRQKQLVSTLFDLCRTGTIEIVVPQLVIDEFDRNKQRVLAESTKSMASSIKRAIGAVELLGNGRRKNTTLAELNDLEHRLSTLRSTLNETIVMVENLLQRFPAVETTDEILVKASRRAMSGKAPFHRQRNSISDALILELYLAALADAGEGVTCIFVTHNTRDFSMANGDFRKPHADLAESFDNARSVYSINLLETLRGLVPDVVEELEDFTNFDFESRDLAELTAAENEFFDKVWYGRHCLMMNQVERGEMRVVSDKEYTSSKESGTIMKSIYTGAKRAGRRVEKQYGRNNLGPYTDFEWGMLNGKLSAIRWVLGFEWDMLDT